MHDPVKVARRKPITWFDSRLSRQSGSEIGESRIPQPVAVAHVEKSAGS